MKILKKIVKKIQGKTYPYNNLKNKLNKLSNKLNYSKVNFKDETIDVVLLTLNRLIDTKRTIESLYKTTVKFNLIIIDQNSNDGTNQYLKDLSNKKNNIKLILLNENIGVSGGRAMAIKHCKTNYVAFIDNDMIFINGYFENLLFTLQNNNCIAALGKIVLPNELIELNSPQFTIENNWIKFFDLDKNKNFNNITTFNQNNVDWIPGVAMWKKEIFNKEKIDKDLIGAFEDNEYSYRLKTNGYKFTNCPAAIVIHLRAEFTKSLNDKTYTQGRHNSKKLLFAVKRFFIKHNLYFSSGEPKDFVKNIGFNSTKEYVEFLNKKD